MAKAVPTTQRRPPSPAELRERLRELDTRFRQETGQGDQVGQEKMLIQKEMGYMRQKLAEGRRGLNVTYPVNPPYAFVQIRHNAELGEHEYMVREPVLDADEQDQLGQIKRLLEASTDSDDLPTAGVDNLRESPEVMSYLREKFDHVVDLYELDVPRDRARALFYHVQRDMIGLGKPDAVLRDPFVEDVSCNGTRLPIYVFHRVFGSVRTNVMFDNELELNKYILQLAQSTGKHVSIYSPILDAQLQDGSRINLTLGTEVTKKGSTFSIRKFNADPITPVDLIRFGSVNSELMAWMWQLIDAKKSLLVSGGTASGKTTLLNALGMFIRQEEKVVSIEDTPEIHLTQENWIQSVARKGYGMSSGGQQAGSIDMFDLLVAALRQRPEYVLVGEVRGKEAFTLFQAISTGHAAMATIHAANVQELINRVENEPMEIPRVMFQALDAVVFPGQVTRDGQRLRRVQGATEILEMDGETGNLLTNDAYKWHPGDDTHIFQGRSYVMESVAEGTGRSLSAMRDELHQKQRFLDMMVNAGMSHVSEVTRAVNDYVQDPRAAMDEMSTKGGHG